MKNIYILTTEDPLYSKNIIQEIYNKFPENITGVGLSGGLITFKRILLSPLIYGFYNYIIFGIKILYGKFYRGKIEKFCISKKIRVDVLPSVKDGKLYEILIKEKVDLLILINCSRKLFLREIEAPSYGTINIHFGDLPKYRGLMTILHAIRLNEKENGITIHYVNKDLDSGKILDKEFVPIYINDNLLSIWHRSTEKSKVMLVEIINKIFSHELIKTKENLDDLSNYFSFPSLIDILHYRWTLLKKRFFE